MKQIIFFGLAALSLTLQAAESWTSRKDVESAAATLRNRCLKLAQVGNTPDLKAFVKDVQAFATLAQELQSGAGFKDYPRVLSDFRKLEEEYKQMSADFTAIEKSRSVDVRVRSQWLSVAVSYQYLWRSVTSGLSYEQITS